MKVDIIGFEGNSISLREDNADVHPTSFQWTTKGDGDLDTVFFCDGGLKDAYTPMNSNVKKIALLVEPPSLHPENYDYVREHFEDFNWVLSYDDELLRSIHNGMFYQLGGSSIAFEDWGMYPKTKDTCMFFSGKDTTPGHKLRKEIVERYGDDIDIYGQGVGKPVERKLDVLRDYEFCVVVESEKREAYFTEKLIDCFATGTIPIYWGSVYAEEIFGIRNPFNDSETFTKMYYDYDLFEQTTQKYFSLARPYAIAEDMLFADRPGLFKEIT